MKSVYTSLALYPSSFQSGFSPDVRFETLKKLNLTAKIRLCLKSQDVQTNQVKIFSPMPIFYFAMNKEGNSGCRN